VTDGSSNIDRPDSDVNDAALIAAAKRDALGARVPGVTHHATPGSGGADGDLLAGPGTTTSASFTLPADSFAGYQVVREVHRGGQGVVYQAVQKSTKRKVALKVMREGPFATASELARFEREVQVLGRLNHPNIVAIHDSGTAAGCQFFVMDYISGQPLDIWMASGTHSVRETLTLFGKICEAVNAAHLQGVTHRDIKPGNIRIDDRGEPHVLDFGLAKVAGALTAPADNAGMMTLTGQFVGTLPWASPEQAEGTPAKIDLRTDVYSLGVILFQMLTGKFPYEVTGNMRDVLDRIIQAPPVPPRRLSKHIDDEVETIVLRCLAKEREQRYQSAGELARDIQHYLKGDPIEAKRDSLGYVMRKQLRRYRLQVAIGVGFVTLLAAGLVLTSVFYFRADADRRRAEEASRREKTSADKAVAASLEARYQAYVGNVTAAGAAFRLYEALPLRARLEACPVELRGWEWRHLLADADSSVATLRGHRERVCYVAFSPDSKRLVTASLDHTARVWDIPSGTELAVLSGHTAALLCAVFSPDGTRILTASEDKTAKLWDAATGQEQTTLLGHIDSLNSAVFSPDGRRVATASDDRTAKIWDAATGGELTTLRGHQDSIDSVVFSPDGRSVATSSTDHTAKLWDPVSGEELATLRGHSARIISVAFSPDGTRIATASEDNTARLWDMASGQELATLSGHTGWVSSISFSPDGRTVVTASLDATARLWDTTTGRELAILHGHTIGLAFAGFSPDGRRVGTASFDDKTVRFWDAATGEELTTLRGHTERITHAAFSPDGRWLASVSHDLTARIWDAAAGEEGSILRGHTGFVLSAVFSRDGRRIVTASWDGTAKVWQVATGRELATLCGHSHYVNFAAFSPDGRRIVTASQDKTAKLWDADTGRELLTLRGHGERLHTAMFSPDGQKMVTSSVDKTAKIWNVVTGQEVATLRGHTAVLNSAAFSPDGREIITASADGTAKVWDLATGREVAAFVGHCDAVHCAAFSSDGRRVVTASEDKTAKLWDADIGRELLTFRGHNERLRTAIFSPDGSRVVTASADGRAIVWDAATGQELDALHTYKHFVLYAEFSPDGKRIVTALSEGTVRLLDSVPYAQRFAERQAALAETDKALPLVTALHQRLSDWGNVAKALREASDIDETVRQQALDLVLKLSSIEINSPEAAPPVRNPANGHS
jgi:WD40 repeat protein/predicted Ser/Thr protein kinase